MTKLYKLSIAVLFAFGVFNAQTHYDDVLKNYLNGATSTFNSSKPEAKQFKIINTDSSQALGGAVLQVQQTYNGVPIYGAVASALVKNDQVVHFSDNFRKNIVVVSTKTKASLNAEQALKGLGIKVKALAKSGQEFYFPTENGLVFAYAYTYEDHDGILWNVVVDAQDGSVLLEESLTLSCNFAPGMYGRPHQHRFIGPLNQPQNLNKSILAAADHASYHVFALPIEAPSFGNRSIVSDPWDNTASPEGWHSDGTNHYTITRGNNVHAYTDLDGTNNIGFSADGGTGRNFDFPLDLNLTHEHYQDAALTNLFYMNNMLHDISYQFGFTESARNFQTNNFGKGGYGHDAVKAEARDGINKATPNLNNANFATPSDGGAPRMQMFLWDPIKVERIFFNSPNDFTDRRPNSKTASFGPKLTATGVTGDLALTTPLNGCTNIDEDLTGKIALIARGSCNFTVKVKNAQTKGAIAAIIYNIPSSTSFGPMGGTDASVTIPSVLIEASEGDAIKAQLEASTVNVTLKDNPDEYLYIDGDFDNGIIAHEYTHGISNRLTGDGYGCLSSSLDNEQMGEGWSDFLALMLTNRPGDTADVPRGIGTYASGEPTDGLGIRPAKYSPDFSINNYTYGKTNGMYYTENGMTRPHVHSIGFVWATILWDLHWKYAEKYGYASDVTADMNSGSARVLQTVMDGMKLQGCNPTFVKGRDAIIAADQNLTGGDNKCLIWKVFAKRGVGVNADPGLIQPKSRFNNADIEAALNDQVEDFTIPAECNAVMATTEAQTSQNVAVYPNPAQNEIFVKADASAGLLSVNLYDATGKLVVSQKVKSQEPIRVAHLNNGLYILKVEGLNVNFSEKIIIKK